MAHIGVIEELERQGYDITSVAGTSMGALVGGTYASGHMEDYKNWMYTLDKRKVFNLIDFSARRSGLIKGDRVMNTMKEFVPEANIEDLRIPYSAIAVDLIREEEVVISSGSLYHAIRSSISIPSVLQPVKYKDQVLVDGGVLNNIPIDHVVRNKRDILVVVYVNANTPLLRPPSNKDEDDANEHVYQQRLREFYDHLPKRHKKEKDEISSFGYFNLLNKTTSMMTGRIAEDILEKNKIDIMINVSKDSCSTFDFYKSEEVVENGRWAAMKALENIG